MDYKRLLQMKEELKDIRSDIVSISKEDYNNLLKISNEDFVCINTEEEVELDTKDLRSLVTRCLNFYSTT